jgi:ABC-type nitrate/sulfonate/bicarbonate transport system substrate-binding protein
MSETLTLIPSKADLVSTTPQLDYSTSAAVPTVSALATHLGFLDEEFASEFDIDVIVSRRDHPTPSDLKRGNGYWIRDSELTPAMKNRAAGSDSRLVALSFLETSSPVVTLTSSGIRSVADLKDKRLGILTTREGFRDLGYAQQLKVYTTALSTRGLTLHDIRFVPFERDKPAPIAFRPQDEKIKTPLEVGRDIAERLQRHEFDAIAVDSASDVAHHASIRILYDTLEHPDYLARAHADTLRGIVVSGHVLRERRDLIVRVLARLLQAAEWAKAHPEDTAVALAGRFSINFDGLTGKYKNLSEGLQVNLGIEKILSLKAQKNFLLRHRLLPKDFDIDPWIDHGPLVEAHVLYASWKEAGRVVALDLDTI